MRVKLDEASVGKKREDGEMKDRVQPAVDKEGQ